MSTLAEREFLIKVRGFPEPDRQVARSRSAAKYRSYKAAKAAGYFAGESFGTFAWHRVEWALLADGRLVRAAETPPSSLTPTPAGRAIGRASPEAQDANNINGQTPTGQAGGEG